MKKNVSMIALILCALLSGCSKKDSTPETVYTKVSVTKLTIQNYPINDPSNNYWDGSLEGLYPDVFFRFTNAGTTNVLYTLPTANRAENLQVANLPQSWASTSGAPFFVLSDLTQGIDVDVYDYDVTSANDFMGTVTFNFNNYTTGSSKYPSTVTVTNGSLSIKLDLIWLQ